MAPWVGGGFAREHYDMLTQRRAGHDLRVVQDTPLKKGKLDQLLSPWLATTSCPDNPPLIPALCSDFYCSPGTNKNTQLCIIFLDPP